MIVWHLYVVVFVWSCTYGSIPILVTTLPEWLSGTKPWPRRVFCVHIYSFAGLIRRTLPPTFSDTAITDRHSDTTIFQLRAHWVRKSWASGSEIVWTCATGGSSTLEFLRERQTPYPIGQALRAYGSSPILFIYGSLAIG